MSTVENLPSPIQSFRHELGGMEQQFAAALPKHIPTERFARVVMTAVSQNPDLLKCARRSLWNAAMKAAQDGLLPDGREGAIVEYKGQAQWMPMIAGLRKKVRNSGEIATWECHVVYENDEFDFALGDDPHIAHKPAMVDAGKPIAAYSIATLKSGERSREVMTVAEIEAVRSRSRAGKGPWFTDWSEMARKTVARRHAKVLPMSTDLDDLIRRDDELYNFSDGKDEDKPRTLAGRLERLAIGNSQADTEQHNQETGEVIEEVAQKEPEPEQEPEAATLADWDARLGEAAKEGYQALKDAWAEVPSNMHQTLKSALDRRHIPTATLVDKGRAEAARAEKGKP